MDLGSGCVMFTLVNAGEKQLHLISGPGCFMQNGPQAGKPTSLTGYKLWDIIRIEDTLHHTA